MSKPAEEIRREVSQSYSEMVAKTTGGGCCGSAPAQKGAVAKLGGYSGDELSALPNDAITNSFGCGNPVALAGLRAGDVVIDLGSGAGIDLFLAAKKVGPTDIVAKGLPEELLALPALYSSCIAGAISEEEYLTGLRAAGLVDVEVRDRLIYDADQLAAIALEATSGCVVEQSPVLRKFARTLEGKVWSAKVYGRKPR